MSALLLPNSVAVFEIDLGLLLVVVLVWMFARVAILTAFALAMLRLGEKGAPEAAKAAIAGLEAKNNELRALTTELTKRVARQAETIGAVRGARKHMKMVGA